MTDAHIINALRDVIAQDYGTEALAVDAAVIVLEQQGYGADSLRKDVQRVWGELPRSCGNEKSK